MEILCHVRNPICTILASTIWYAYAPCWTVAVNKTEIMHLSSCICKVAGLKDLHPRELEFLHFGSQLGLYYGDKSSTTPFQNKITCTTSITNGSIIVN
jgi:hypothetical protein